MADLLQTMMIYFRDPRQLAYQLSKAEWERRVNEFQGAGGNGYASFLGQVGAGERRSLDKAELRALADYGRAVNDLFVDWQVVAAAFHREIKHRDDDAALQGRLDQFDALLQEAEAVTVPDRAAAVQRVFIALLRSERAYFQNVFDDVDDELIGQYTADSQEEAARFLAEFDRLLRISGQSLQGPHSAS
jgi:hypothetical protein